MVGTLLVVLLVVAAGTRAADSVRLKQQQVILEQLPQSQAVDYYKVLRRRAWTARFLRAIAVLSMFAIIYATRTASRNAAPPAPPRQTAPASP